MGKGKKVPEEWSSHELCNVLGEERASERTRHQAQHLPAGHSENTISCMTYTQYIQFGYREENKPG